MKITQRLWESHLRQKRFSGDLLASCGLVFVVTNRCNFACRHCLRQSATPEDLSLETAERILDEAKAYGFNQVSITGGEPLVYPHLQELIKKIVDHGYSFNMVTNGYDFKAWAPFLKSVRPHILFVAFSVEGATRATHDAMRRAGSWDRLSEAFLACRQNKIPFNIITAISRANHSEVFDIALLAKKKGARGLIASTVMPCSNADQNDLVLEHVERRKLCGALMSLSKALGLPISITAALRGLRHIKICRSLEMLDIAVNAKGELVQCCDLANHDDARLRQRAVIADLNTQSFREGLKSASRHIDRFIERRIDALARQRIDGIDPVDFNSCFYCLRDPRS
jgi:organic radical activating enzyme